MALQEYVVTALPSPITASQFFPLTFKKHSIYIEPIIRYDGIRIVKLKTAEM